MRGDEGVLDALGGSPTADDVDRAASYGRWALVLQLLERGAPITITGLTPLHLAAGAGELDVVRSLLDRGADPVVRDPQFHATPQQWADFLRQADVSALLAGRSAGSDDP